MTNRYVVEGLIEDLIWENQDIMVIGPTHDIVKGNVFDPVVRRINAVAGFSGAVSRISRSEGVIETEPGALFMTASARSFRGIGGRRGDIWVLYRRREWPEDNLALGAVIREARRNNAEVIEID